MTSATPSFTFNLHLTEGATALAAGENLFEGELKQVLTWIEAHLKDLPALDARAPKRRQKHESILLSGARGSGKSTFMHSLMARIESDTSLNRDIASLEALDPTLIDGDEVFLAAIVARILSHLRSKRKDDGTEVQTALMRLGPALLVLDHGASRDMLRKAAEAPALFGETLLNMAISGIDLQRRFEDFVDAATRAVGVKCFALFLDDVDTAFAQGYQVLETIRRYCVNGRLLPIVSGDIELFRLVVRERVWRELRSLANEQDNQREVQRQVVELEGQYLLKVLRPDRRLALPSPRDRLRSFESVEVRDGSGKASERQLDELIDAANSKIFAVPTSETKVKLPYPAGALLTHNARQIRSAIKWLFDRPKGDGDARITTGSESATQILQLHPRQHEAQLEPAVLQGIDDGDYSALATWLCGAARQTDLYRLDPARMGSTYEDEPRVIASLAVSAALVHRWRREPADQIRFLGNVLSPVLALSRLPEGDPSPTARSSRPHFGAWASRRRRGARRRA